MKTLGKNTTRNFYINEDGYDRIRAIWSGIKDKGHHPTAAEHLLYMAVIGRDFRKAFTPITNFVKITNGLAPLFGAKKALETVQHWLQCIAKDGAWWNTPFLQAIRDELRPEFAEHLLGLLPANSDVFTEGYAELAAHVQVPYCYVFIRTDIPVSDQIVQVGHVCLDAGKKFNPPEHTHMVVCKVSNFMELEKVHHLCQQNNIATEKFYEPDDGMGHTGICTQPIYGNTRSIFKRYRLWR